MKGLEQLRKKSKHDLTKMAKKLRIKVAVGWNRTTLATKILEKQKLNELKDEPVQPKPESEPESDESRRRPDFEDLASEGPEIVPDSSQVEEQGPGGYRPGAGRTPGLTDEKARVQRILKNQVPDPTIKFAFECLFDGWESAVKIKGIRLSADEADSIAVPTTNLKEYYLPNLDLSPVLQMWIGLAIGMKAVVKSRIALIREARKSEPVAESEKPEDEEKT